MTAAYINRLGVAVPPFDIHRPFSEFAISCLSSEGTRAAFRRLAHRAQIEHRYSFLPPESFLEPEGFYRPGQFPDTLARMRFFEQHAPNLATLALDAIDISSFKDEVTHLIIACCTGFYAPGIDIDIVNRCGLKATVERTMVGFIGCYAAINALKLARHTVRSERHAKVVVVNIESLAKANARTSLFNILDLLCVHSTRRNDSLRSDQPFDKGEVQAKAHVRSGADCPSFFLGRLDGNGEALE
jgi:predicted naringenin-chalcone synthase